MARTPIAGLAGIAPAAVVPVIPVGSAPSSMVDPGLTTPSAATGVMTAVTAQSVDPAMPIAQDVDMENKYGVCPTIKK